MVKGFKNFLTDHGERTMKTMEQIEQVYKTLSKNVHRLGLPVNETIVPGTRCMWFPKDIFDSKYLYPYYSSIQGFLILQDVVPHSDITVKLFRSGRFYSVYSIESSSLRLYLSRHNLEQLWGNWGTHG